MPTCTARELRAWQLESGERGDEPIIANAMKLWTRRVLRPTAVRCIERDDVTVYMLRHTHASMLHYASLTPPEAAARMGARPGPALAHVRARSSSSYVAAATTASTH